LAMFLFSVATVPIMFGFGLVSTSLGQKLAGKMIIVGAVIIILLGLSLML